MRSDEDLTEYGKFMRDSQEVPPSKGVELEGK